MSRSGKKKPKSGAKPRVVARSSEADNFKAILVCVFLVVIVSIVFAQTLHHDFINYDDDEYITQNVHVLNGLNWADVKWAFTTGHTGYAHPITWLSHQLDYQMHGRWPGGHHLTSVLLHAANSVLLFLFFWRTTKALWPSAFVAAIFAIHPLHVESVGWVAERKDVLSGFFFLLTLHAYVGYVHKRDASRYLLTLCLFAAGILSKPMLVSLPAVLLLLDYWPLKRFGGGKSKTKSLILEKIPFVLIAALWSLITFVIQGKYGAVAEAKLGFGMRAGNAILSYGTYLWNTVWPQNLSLFYPYPRALPLGGVVLSAVFLIVMSILCLARRKTSPYLIVGWLWYLGMLLPVIGFIQVGEQARADRYTYLPLIGFCVLITWGVVELSAKWRWRREILTPLGALALIVLIPLAHLQASYWRNSETLWSHSLASTEGNYIAHNNLGNDLMHRQRLDEAIPHFEKALEILPSYAEANNNLGYALALKDQWTPAIHYYEIALGTKPDYAKAHNNLAVALAVTGKNDEALGHFREVLRIDPDFADAHANLGHLLLQLGRRDEASAELTEALRLRPDDPEVREQLSQLDQNR
jgi:tetratricopeptide (TPR) repeat protein